MENNEKKRSSFSGGIGFVLAAAGSAVGLGNLWRFPYLVAQYGGGIFILVYIIAALTFGFALMTTEIAVGRKTKKSPILAYKAIHKKFGFLGYIAALVPIIILPYYCVIGGWVIKYMATYVGGAGRAAADTGYFGSFIGSSGSPLIFFAIFLAVTVFIILIGVEKGIEKISKFLMPLLLVISVIICIYVCTLPGAGAGIKYYLLPDVSKFSFMTVCAAVGQIFFSMSLAMGIMVTYGSYTKKETNLTKSVNQIEIFDTVVAFMAGFMVVPALYVFSGEAGLQQSGAGLMFETLPRVFDQMGGGMIIGTLFFVLVFFAALTSSISIMEAIVSSFMDKFKMTRLKACIITIVICILLGVPASLGNGAWSNIKLLGMDFLTFFDYLSNSVIMPIVALCTCLLIGWFVGCKVIIKEITRNGERMHRKKLYIVMIKFVAPILLVIILITSSLSQFGIISI
ncbi:Na+-dependent transporters of the SNF family [uncultured Roseburia sp.]|uniref:Transporter n=1 Tax=Brotonthovivens ammoniilytica TaxID=2981725 RepID=A0ABT2TN09_9FIRM|nr:sodium-dependent transporter [Brotonthovivens ammoniilytica]MCU6763603.1 sodium-dependent transporter [Brotonthovivens ammoniilytica]SCJ26562.1 Na+-dependent transporters of the SNF family [uncultured Roseburia sp.]